MKKLSEKEAVVMHLLWHNGPLFVREMIDLMPDPKPHVNTVSTFVRLLEQNGFIGHERIGNSFRYSAAISREEYTRRALKEFITDYYSGSEKELISDLLGLELLNDDDLWDLMAEMRLAKKSKG